MFDRNKFKAQMALNGIGGKELAEKMEMNESTLYRKIRDDGNFTRKEINNLISILHIENPNDIFFN